MSMRKSINKYKRLNAPAKAALWFTVSNILQKGISFITTPVFTRIMTTEQYGVYSVYQSWYSIVIIFATLNLYSGVYNNGMTKFPDDRGRFTSSLQGLSTVITVGLFIIYLCGRKFWENLFGLTSIYILSMFLEILVIPGYNFWSAGQRYDYKYRRQIIVAISITLIVPITGILAVLSTTYKAEARVVSMVFVHAIIAGFFYIYNFVKGKQFFNKSYWKFALSFNIPLIPHYLSQTVLNQADRIMISNIVGNSEAAIYSVAYTVSMMMTIVTNAINNSFVPYTYKSLKQKNISGVRKNSNFLVLVIFIACIMAMSFGPEIIRIVASPDYYEARWIIPPVAASLYFMFLFPLYCNIEFYYEETKCIMVASCIAAFVNVGLNYFAINAFGYIAAAYTTLICYILLAISHYVIHLWVLKKYGFTEKIYNTRFFVVLSTILLIVMVVMTIFYNYYVFRYSIIAVILMVAFAFKKMIVNKVKEITEK